MNQGTLPEGVSHVEPDDGIKTGEVLKKKFVSHDMDAKPDGLLEEPSVISEVAIIGKNTTIKGMIFTKGHTKVEGSIEGGIECDGNLKVSGKIIGDVLGGNIELQACNVKGNLVAKGGIIVGKDIVLNGDIVAEKLILEGAVNGNLKIEKDAHLSEHAMVEGSIVTGKLTMIAGAKVQGYVSVR
ncbi:MAG: polymer-forming cytoskeletal protein [Anaerovorax sp.]